MATATEKKQESESTSRTSTLQRMPKRKQVINAVFPDTKEGKKGFEALSTAAEELKYTVERIPFEKLDFGETDALDKFYSCSIAVADVTDRAYQAKLFYHLGLRESFDMKQNVVTYLDEQQSYRAGRRGSSIDGNTHASFNVSDIGMRPWIMYGYESDLGSCMGMSLGNLCIY